MVEDPIRPSATTSRRSRRGKPRRSLVVRRVGSVPFEQDAASLLSTQKYRGNLLQSGCRFSKNASRPSTASSVMYANRVASPANSC